jgi:gliding motility-associated-like protein
VTENAVTYNWDFGDGNFSNLKNPVHRYKDIGDYLVKLFVNRESVCVDTAGNKVTSESLLGELLYVPNSFTPNGDGTNDFFKFSTYRPCMTYSIEIYNRWGLKIYENDDAGNMEWDGRYQNEMVPADVYVYILKNEEQQRTGVINLIR